MMRSFVGEVTTKGIVTKDYSWFLMDDTNRKISEEALGNLEDDYNANSYGDVYPFQAPIVVYWVEGMEKGVIQQGHHRYTVCVKNKKEINYIITDCYRPCSMGHETEHQDHNLEELVWSYKQQNIKEYEILWDLHEKHPKYTYLNLTLLLNGKLTNTEKIRWGKFEVVGDYDVAIFKAEQRMKRYEEFLLATGRSDYSKEMLKVLIVALERPDFDWKYFIGRCKENADKANLNKEFKSISTNARAVALVQYLYNTNSRKNFFY